jgi:hypothetical protein
MCYNRLTKVKPSAKGAGNMPWKNSDKPSNRGSLQEAVKRLSAAELDAAHPVSMESLEKILCDEHGRITLAERGACTLLLSALNGSLSSLNKVICIVDGNPSKTGKPEKAITLADLVIHSYEIE